MDDSIRVDWCNQFMGLGIYINLENKSALAYSRGVSCILKSSLIVDRLPHQDHVTHNLTSTFHLPVLLLPSSSSVYSCTDS